MPGIIGLIHLSDQLVDENRFERFLKGHRGEDDCRTETFITPDRSAVIGIVHPQTAGYTAIISRAEDVHYLLFFFGEIYNEDLRGMSPAEMILEAYRQEGERIFNRLNGSFIIALINKDKRLFHLICDRSATQPFYYHQIGDILAFGYRLKPFIDLSDRKFSINTEALANFLSCGYILHGKSLLNGVDILGPGKMLSISGDRIDIRSYWQYRLSPERDTRSERDLIEELHHLILTAVQRRLGENKSFGVLLSGGYDSQAILGSMLKLYPVNLIRSITWGEKEKLPFSDADVSRQIADYFKLNHTFYELNASALPDNFRSFVLHDEGRTDSAGNYPEALRIFENIRRELAGGFILRGDECFGWKREVATDKQAFHSLSIHELGDLPENYPYLQPKIRKYLVETDREHKRELLENCPYKDLHDRKDYFYFTERLFGYLHPLTQLKERIIWVRNPFLDNDVLDFVMKLPTKMRLGKALFKSMIQEKFPEFSRFPIAQTSNLIDWDERLRRDSALQSYVKEILFDNQNDFDQLVDKKRLEELLFSIVQTSSNGKTKNRSILRRIRQRMNNRLGRFHLSPSTELFRLMTLKIFADEFLNGEFPLE